MFNSDAFAGQVDMTTKQCGNCKHWGSGVSDPDRQFNMCHAPIPDCAIGNVNINMHKTQGRNCPSFKQIIAKRKELQSEVKK